MFPSSSPKLSVIIPAIDEAESLPSLLQQLRRQQNITLELIIADGGSTDATRTLGAGMGARVVASGAGRGLQMNRGAAISRGEFLLFLHADSRLTGDAQLANAVTALEQHLMQRGHHRVAGHFRLRFRLSDKTSQRPYRYYEAKSALNRQECTNGDQGFLMRRDLFDTLGGFDQSLWFLEDQRLAETIRRQGEWITLPGELVTSTRRFEQEGLLRRMILSALIMNFHYIGLTEFFQRAGSVYRNQAETGRLLMSPIFQLIDELFREAGPARARRHWLATGHYIGINAWQPFFWLDVTLQPLLGRRCLFLRAYDRLLGPVLRLRPFDYLLGGLTWLWFRGTWWVYQRIESRGGGAH